MRKKRNTKFRVIDLAIILFCLTGAGISGTAFWQEYDRTLTKINEEPVGTIVFKKRTAQRKFIERVVWDRLRESSPVYNGDTIRTIAQSEALISFRDKVTRITLVENTLIQIFFDDQQGAVVDFSGGNLEVVSGARAVTVSSGASSIVVEGQASMNKGREGFGLSVLEGQTNFDGKEIARGGIIALDSGGGEYSAPLISMTSFGSSVRILCMPGEAVPVAFSWNAFNFTADTHVLVEVAHDRAFTQIAEARDVRGANLVSVSLRNGNYFWRAYPVNGDSAAPASRIYPSGTLELIPALTPTLLSPGRFEEFSFLGVSSIPLSWSAVEGISAYLLEISAHPDMSAPVVSRRVAGNAVIQTGLESGQWHWRITPVFPDWVKGSVPSSAAGVFSIARRRPVLEEPKLTYPSQSGQIYADFSGHRLLWSYDSRAESWIVELADNPGMINPVVRQDVASNYFTLPAELIEAGKTWYWRVSAQGGQSPAVSGLRNFQVVKSPPIPPPPVQVEPEPEPEPEIIPAAETPRPESRPPARQSLTQVSGTGTVSGNNPPHGYSLTTGQLEGVPSMIFSWTGRASEYRFALYRANGEVLISPAEVSSSRYVMSNPGLLREGDYVWQVYEKNSQGNWGLPSTASRFSVVKGSTAVIDLGAENQGTLYGNR